jgi:hypothetical protein
MRLAISIVLAGLLMLSACATPTPYSPADGTGFGFSDAAIEPNRYRVAFAGNALTDVETVEDGMLYRAAELTLERGYDWFRVVSRDTDRDRDIVAVDIPTTRWINYRYFHPRHGWVWRTDSVWDYDRDYREITRYEAIAEVVMYHGTPPADDASAYNARAVIDSLEPRIRRPQP